jgi:ABC-type multidrug transport system fused ATPase/permease subunit
MLLNLVLVTAEASARVSLIFLTGQVVGRVPGLAAGRPVVAVAWPLAALAAVFAINAVLPVLVDAGAQELGNRVSEDVGTRLTDPLLAPRRIGHLEDPAVADELAGGRGISGFAVSLGVRSVPRALGARLTMVGLALLVGTLFSWWAAIATVASTVAAEWFVSRSFAREFAAWHEQAGAHRRADYVFELGMRGSTKELRVFGLSGFLIERYTREWATAMAPMWRARSRSVVHDVAAMAVHLAVIGGAVVIAARAAAAGTLSVGAATSTVAAVFAIGTTIDCFSAAEIARGRDALRSMLRLPALIEERHPTIVGVDPAPPGESRDGSEWPCRSIRFDGVSFRYPGADSDVLRGLDLEIPASESMALVGINGAGKSTVVKLLAGCYRPIGGRITVDGVDLAALDEAALGRWQRQVAAIVQDFLRFPLPAADNVRLGAVERGDDEPALADVAARSGIADLVAALPRGWETVLDRTFDQGVDLSGGQWQRVALARALFAVRAGARVLVLDEPAAALDVRAEAELVRRYLDLTRSITSLIISHRFSVVRDARRICVLDGGRIVEQGSHDELLAGGGRYASLFSLQAQRYAGVDAPRAD